MASPRKIVACGEHKLSVEVDEREEKNARLQRAQWLRAAILGANDGLLSTTSLMLGVGAAKEEQRSMILSGLAGAHAGACSMAVGEFVSVSTQRDIESSVAEKHVSKASEGDDATVEITPGLNPMVVDINMDSVTNSTVSALGGVKGREPYEIKSPFSPKLTSLGKVKGIDQNETNSAVKGEGPFECERASPGRNSLVLCSSPMMKIMVADSRMNRINDEKISEDALPNPYKAAGASAGAFVCGSIVPLVPAICVAENTARIIVIVIVTSIALVLFGGIGARLGGSPWKVSALRVLFGGWISMAITYSLLKPLDRNDKGTSQNDLTSTATHLCQT